MKKIEQIESWKRESNSNPRKASGRKYLSRTVKLAIVSVVALSFVIVGMSALLQSFGTVETTATVSQSIVFDGKEDNTPVEHSFNVYGGCCKCIKEIIKNRACIEGTVDLQTTYDPDGDGIITTIYQVPEYTTLVLENKDSNWAVIDDGTQATLKFETMKTTFDYTFDANGLTACTDYCLIYYADPWEGNNPGAYIGTFTTDGSGVISTTGSKDLGMNLPSEPDENILKDYSGSPDYYTHAHGAKIWLVLASDYNTATCEMTGWNPTAYLFETDLIGYSDCNLECPCWLAPMLSEPITSDLVIPAKTNMKLIFCYDFAINIAPGIYVISTDAVPVV